MNIIFETEPSSCVDEILLIPSYDGGRFLIHTEAYGEQVVPRIALQGLAHILGIESLDERAEYIRERHMLSDETDPSAIHLIRCSGLAILSAAYARKNKQQRVRQFCEIMPLSQTFAIPVPKLGSKEPLRLPRSLRTT